MVSVMRCALLLAVLLPLSAGCDGVTIMFDDPADLERFEFTDPSEWSLVKDGDRDALDHSGAGHYEPAVRAPIHRAILKEREFGNFVLVAEVRQTGREYAHRDLCLFFDYQSPTRFYYVHLATTPDEHACNVFLVDDADRRRLAAIPAEGIDWGDGWHLVGLLRNAESGLIRVMFDDVTILECFDTTLATGRIGFGSFDDSGRIAGLAAAEASVPDGRPHEPPRSP